MGLELEGRDVDTGAKLFGGSKNKRRHHLILLRFPLWRDKQHALFIYIARKESRSPQYPKIHVIDRKPH